MSEEPKPVLLPHVIDFSRTNGRFRLYLHLWWHLLDMHRKHFLCQNFRCSTLHPLIAIIPCLNPYCNLRREFLEIGIFGKQKAWNRIRCVLELSLSLSHLLSLFLIICASAAVCCGGGWWAEGLGLWGDRAEAVCNSSSLKSETAEGSVQIYDGSPCFLRHGVWPGKVERESRRVVNHNISVLSHLTNKHTRSVIHTSLHTQIRGASDSWTVQLHLFTTKLITISVVWIGLQMWVRFLAITMFSWMKNVFKSVSKNISLPSTALHLVFRSNLRHFPHRQQQYSMAFSKYYN